MEPRVQVSTGTSQYNGKWWWAARPPRFRRKRLARASRAGHQHFRNVTSQEVLPFARRRALQVVEHHPASFDTTNEWILLLQRT